MGWWRDFMEFDRKGILVAKVKGRMAFTHRGYVIDRLVFRVYLALVLLCILAVGFFSSVGWREAYAYCPEDTVGKCWNPCFQKGERCAPISHQEFLSPGEAIGNPQHEDFDERVRGLWFVIFGGALLAFALNHLWHNRGRPVSHLFPKLEVEE